MSKRNYLETKKKVSSPNSMYLKATDAFKVVKTLLIITSIWPHDKKKLGRYKALFYEAVWCFSFLNIFFMFIPICLNVYFARERLIEMMQSLSVAEAVFDCSLNILITRYNRVELMVIIF